MIRLLRLTLATLLLAAPALFSLAPRPAHAFCITCDDVHVYEYVNEITGHYLLLPQYDPEVAFVEGGGAGPGWVRTGNDFTTATFEPLPVCRFYSPVFNTHFYTADATECEIVKQNPDWIYEKSPFNAAPAPNGSCDAPTVPVYRFYHAGDHRYTADTGVRDAMRAKGWTYEGIGFCVENGGREATKTLSPGPQRIDSVQGCTSTAGACIALDSLPAMPNRVPPLLPPSYTMDNPAFPGDDISFLVGTTKYFSDIYTSQPSTIVQHSFASLFPGLYISGRDRTGGDYAGISPMVELPGVPGDGADQRLFLWRGASDVEVRVNEYMNIGVVAREGAGHAYGGQLIQFGDATSGHSFRVTAQAYGTQTPGDFVAPDARTGEPIVSTVFRPDPMFGHVVAGSFIACRGDGTQCSPGVTPSPPNFFSFGLKRAEFQAAVDRARSVDPALSRNPADYFVARVALLNETYLDARVGMTVSLWSAEVWYVEP